MKVADFRKIWPEIQGKPVKIFIGYRSPHWVGPLVFVRMNDWTGRKMAGADIFIITESGACYTVRPIKEIKLA